MVNYFIFILFYQLRQKKKRTNKQTTAGLDANKKHKNKKYYVKSQLFKFGKGLASTKKPYVITDPGFYPYPVMICNFALSNFRF